MKKNVKTLLTTVISMSFLAVGFMADTDEMPTEKTSTSKTEEVVYAKFFYSLTPRFEPKTKSELQQVASVADFFGPKHLQPLLNYESVEVVIIENDQPTGARMNSKSYKLSDEQLQMLRALDYSQHFLIRAAYHAKNEETGVTENHVSEPYFTVVPEKQAAFNLGEKALIDYLAAGNKENTANLDESKLQFATLYFTVTQHGSVTNVHLDRTSGSKKIDAAMIKLITTAPGTWKPAQDAQGKIVDQELVVTFGIGGC